MTNTRLLLLTALLLLALGILLVYVTAQRKFESTRSSMINRGAEVNGTSLANLELIWPVDSKEFLAKQAPADASEAFRKTFAACAENGGRVFIPPGYWWVPKLKTMPVRRCPSYGLGSKSHIDTVVDFSPLAPAVDPRTLLKPSGGCIMRDADQYNMPFPMSCP
ncbi:MAG TPA: hypothetical protein VK789_28430 [Bryobacteraceae bacterium]|jgi:hypothetical protein|nr:hypothetical protein [Bryobacteraceae bacterium]